MMRSRKILVCLFMLGIVSAAAAQPVFVCEECRGPHRHFTDFGNFAFNAVFGANPWIGPGAGQAEYNQPLMISNLAGQIVAVYFEIPKTLFPRPTEAIVIAVEKPNGVVEKYEVLTSRMGSDLPVGTNLANSGPRLFGGGGGGGRGGAHGPPPGSIGLIAAPRPRRCGTTDVDGGGHRRTCI